MSTPHSAIPGGRRRGRGRPRQRLFLDTGVLIGGANEDWGPSRTLLVYLRCVADRYITVLAQAVLDELDGYRALIARRPPSELGRLMELFIDAWLSSARPEVLPRVDREQVDRYRRELLPVLRHENDLPAVVSAVIAAPDWIISTNREHWSPGLAWLTGLRIVTPRMFLDRLPP